MRMATRRVRSFCRIRNEPTVAVLRLNRGNPHPGHRGAYRCGDSANAASARPQSTEASSKTC
jgi:hypothetical protein